MRILAANIARSPSPQGDSHEGENWGITKDQESNLVFFA